jgi:hypothetical protein
MKPLKTELEPHVEFELRTMQQSAQSLTKDDAIDLLCTLMRQNAHLRAAIGDLLKP